MKKVHEIQNLRMIKVSFLIQTNSHNGCICIQETINEKTECKFFDYDHQMSDVQQQALEILQANDFKVVCRSFSTFGSYFFLCEWEKNFKKVSELK